MEQAMQDHQTTTTDTARRETDARRLDRRDVLRRSALGLAVPAVLAGTGATPGGATAKAVANDVSGFAGSGQGNTNVSGGGLSRPGLNRMHEVLAGHVERGNVPGLVTLVSRRGEVHADAIGVTAFDGDTPMRRDTIFRIASVTKPILAAATMTLIEDCTLRLDDPVDPLLPELANRQVLRAVDSELDDTVPANRPISLRDLLTFRSGYGAIFAPPDQSPVQKALVNAGVAAGPVMPALAPDEFMRVYADLPLLHQPGEQWLYNTGSDLLGVLIARATGMSLGDVLRERLFEPLGMKDTGFSVPAGKRDRLPATYWTNIETGEFGVFDSAEDSRWHTPPVFESGAGGLVSTVDDLLAFGQMMLAEGRIGNARILLRPSVAVMTTDQLQPEQKIDSSFFPGFWDSHGWGFGVAIDIRRDDLSSTPGRFGWDGGYGTSWYVDPHEELIGILMTQRVWDATGIPQQILSDFWTTVYAALDD
jgi:CubicO group peptidase (beta-lactamase class C family)